MTVQATTKKYFKITKKHTKKTITFFNPKTDPDPDRKLIFEQKHDPDPYQLPKVNPAGL
jgi:hypothetical protein